MGSKDFYLHVSGLKLDDNEIKDDVLGTHYSLFGNMFSGGNFVDSENELSKIDNNARKNNM